MERNIQIQPLHVAENVHTVCGILFLQAHVLWSASFFFSSCCFGEHDHIVAEICGYSARSISLPFPSLTSDKPPLQHALCFCGSAERHVRDSDKKKERSAWNDKLRQMTVVTQSRAVKVTLALSKDTELLRWWPRLYLVDWMSKFIIAWWSHMLHAHHFKGKVSIS